LLLMLSATAMAPSALLSAKDSCAPKEKAYASQLGAATHALRQAASPSVPKRVDPTSTPTRSMRGKARKSWPTGVADGDADVDAKADGDGDGEAAADANCVGETEAAGEELGGGEAAGEELGITAGGQKRRMRLDAVEKVDSET